MHQKLTHFSSDSSSFHCLNADLGLRWLNRKLYVLLNAMNNYYPHLDLDPKLQQSQFLTTRVDELWGNLPAPDLSPSRCLCELFWMELPWSDFVKELGEIHLLDVGCGRGEYGERLSNYSRGSINSYTGVDIRAYPEWQLRQESLGHTFLTYDGKHLQSSIPDKVNFIITQSAIEHFSLDLFFFKQVRSFIEKSKRRIVQVHLFPSAVGLKIFPFHGVRQYTPRTISRITRLFPDSSKQLFLLGGEQSAKLHYEFITSPIKKKNVDMRQGNKEQYQLLLPEAIKEDIKSRSQPPIFYALILRSNYSGES